MTGEEVWKQWWGEDKIMRKIELNRDEAEWLVDLLEDCDPMEEGMWRFSIADEIRQAFGMVPREEERP